MNINWGLFPPLKEKVSKKIKYIKLAERALKILQNWIKENLIIE